MQISTLGRNDMDTDAVFDVLQAIFTHFVYPMVILGVFAVIGSRMRALITEHAYDSMLQRRLAVAALLPVTVLTFVLVGKLPQAAVWLPGEDQWALQLALGALITVATLEASLHISSRKQALTFMLYLGSLAAALLYVLMEGALARFQPAVFAGVVMGGLHFIFRERRTGMRTETPETWTPQIEAESES
jgi:hypothetical protein